MTTAEIINILESENINEEAFSRISSVLNICDLVKFAKLQPEGEEQNRSLRYGYEIIDLTKIIMIQEPQTVAVVDDIVEEPSEEKLPEPETINNMLPAPKKQADERDVKP